jgi:hypothetical protein
MRQSPKKIDIERWPISEKAWQWLYSIQEGKCSLTKKEKKKK